MKIYEVWDGVERGGPGSSEEYCGTFATRKLAEEWIASNVTQCWGFVIKEKDVIDSVKIDESLHPKPIMHWEYWMDRALEAESQIHYNGLSPAETERLDMLVEELSEAILIAQKIKRHGYESYHPEDPNKTPNRRLLEIELGDALGILNKMYYEEDLNENIILSHAYRKWDRSFKYTHHQTNET